LLDIDKLAKCIEDAQHDKDLNFAALYQYAWPHVYTLAFGLLQNEEDAADISQDAFLYLYQKIDAIKKPRAGLRYIDRLVVNKINNARRDHKLHGSALPLDGDDPSRQEKILSRAAETAALSSGASAQPQASGYRLEGAERDALILNAVHELPDSSREVIFLRYWGEYRNADIAELVQENESTVAMRLTRARQQLKEIMLRQVAVGDIEFWAATVGFAEVLQQSYKSLALSAPTKALWQTAAGSVIAAETATKAGAAGKTAVAKKSSLGKLALIGGAAILALCGGYAIWRATTSVGGNSAPPASVSENRSEQNPPVQDDLAAPSSETTLAATVATSTPNVNPSAGNSNSTVPPTPTPTPAPDQAPAAPTAPALIRPTITVALAQISYPLNARLTAAGILADSGAIAHDAQGRTLTVIVSGLGTVDVTQQGTYKVFLHTTDSNGTAALTGVVNVVIMP